MAYKFVPYAPEGSGGKDPVLAELTVTENGVYDNPTIGGEVKIAVGNTIQFKKVITIDDVPEELRPTDNMKQLPMAASNNWIWMLMLIAPSGIAIIGGHSVDGSLDNTDEGYVYLDETSAPLFGAEFGLTEPGWYWCDQTVETPKYIPTDDPPSIVVVDADMEYLNALYSFFSAPSTPADGWNKVTVNVAGGGDSIVVDVESLPTENVDDSKIYRTTETLEPDGEIYIAQVNTWDEPITASEYVKMNFGMDITVIYHVVESPPETLLVSDGNTATYHVYIVPETGKSYVTMDNVTISDFMADYNRFGIHLYQGVISSIDEATQDGYYFCVSGGGQRIIYGIPDKVNTKETFEYTADGEWVARIGIIDVTELPTTNIKDGAAYRLSTESNMYVYESWFGERYTLQEARPGTVLHIVEELPEQMIPGDYNDGGAWHVYVVESTGIGYYSTTGDPSTDLRTLSWCMLFPEWLGDNMGCIDSLDEITRDGFYFLRGADNVSMHTHSDDGWSGYINEGTYNAINEEKKEAIKNVTDLTVKCSAAVGYVTDEGLINFINAANCENGADGVEVTGTTDKNITSITIPSGVAVVGKEAFKEHTALTTVTLSEGVTMIRDSAFYGCTALTSVTFPSTFAGMYYEKAFADCTSMQYYDFTALSSRPYIGSSDMFENIPAACQIRVADEVYDQWITYYNGRWKDHIVKASDVV